MCNLAKFLLLHSTQLMNTNPNLYLRLYLAINHFLIDTYSNYLLYLYNNGEINTCELDYLYLLFITELRQMLDIKLPINKDLLNRNISDNAWIHSERIRRKL